MVLTIIRPPSGSVTYDSMMAAAMNAGTGTVGFMVKPTTVTSSVSSASASPRLVLVVSLVSMFARLGSASWGTAFWGVLVAATGGGSRAGADACPAPR
ncbi:hypothetical protein MHU86_18832 [Fragilaria crotonensis]|nr:hypothetical protein MHU86_18832 [Fragilaria crotonensis]